MYILVGVIISWLVIFVELLFLTKEIPMAQKILQTPEPYNYVNLFLLILWGPFVEETLYRGYFFEILREKLNDPIAIIFSSLLFVLFHGMWGQFSISLIFIFLFSLIFTIMYISGGLIASISVHAFTNFYLTYLNY